MVYRWDRRPKSASLKGRSSNVLVSACSATWGETRFDKSIANYPLVVCIVDLFNPTHHIVVGRGGRGQRLSPQQKPRHLLSNLKCCCYPSS